MSSPSTGTASSAHPLSPIRDPTLLAHYDRLVVGCWLVYTEADAAVLTLQGVPQNQIT